MKKFNSTVIRLAKNQRVFDEDLRKVSLLAHQETLVEERQFQSRCKPKRYAQSPVMIEITCFPFGSVVLIDGVRI